MSMETFRYNNIIENRVELTYIFVDLYIKDKIVKDKKYRFIYLAEKREL